MTQASIMDRMDSIQEAMSEIAQNTQNINHIREHATPTELAVHNDNAQGGILLNWEKLTALLGHQDLTRNAGFETSAALIEMPAPKDGPEPERTRELLSVILVAADSVNLQNDPNREATDEEIADHNDGARRNVMTAWEELAAMLEQGELLLEFGQDEPAASLWDLQHDHLRALGAAALHGCRAIQGFNLVRDQAGGPSPGAQSEIPETMARAQGQAKLAHRIGWLFHNRLEPQADLGPHDAGLLQLPAPDSRGSPPAGPPGPGRTGTPCAQPPHALSGANTQNQTAWAAPILKTTSTARQHRPEGTCRAHQDQPAELGPDTGPDRAPRHSRREGRRRP